MLKSHMVVELHNIVSDHYQVVKYINCSLVTSIWLKIYEFIDFVDHARTFVQLIVRTASDINTLIDSLPSEELTQELQVFFHFFNSQPLF